MNQPDRRKALQTLGAIGSSLVLPAPVLAESKLGESKRPGRPVKLGLIADLHGGLAPDAMERLETFLGAMKEASCDALVQLGDFAFPNAKHQAFPDAFMAGHDKTLHVIGNHEFDHGLKRADCLKAWGMEASYYRSEIGGIRILALDANERGSPSHGGGYPSYIGPKQRDWLEAELKEATQPVLILSHQPLAGHAAIDNAEEIQKLLGRFRSKILLCVNGHTHIDSLVMADGVPFLHLNSASYFWVGGPERMAHYAKPLFSTLTIDPASATIRIEPSTSSWKDQSPEEIGYFDRKTDPPKRAAVVPRIRAHRVSRRELKVMSWNIWGRLNEDPRYQIEGKTSRERTIEILQESGADLIGMIETYGSAAAIARALNFHHYTPASDANLCIFSRYPLSDIAPLKGLNPFSFIAATVTLPGGRKVRFYNIWLTSGGRHIVEIKNPEISDEAFAAGDENRHQHLQQLLKHEEFLQDLAKADTVPLIVAGDFNCVSHLDHTPESKAAGLNYGRVLPIATSLAMEKAGLTDSYRAAHPEITEETLGHTWTTVGKDWVWEKGKDFMRTDDHPRPHYQDPYTRIDRIYCRGLRVAESSTLTRHHETPERQFPEWPSDHGAVLSRLELE